MLLYVWVWTGPLMTGLDTPIKGPSEKGYCRRTVDFRNFIVFFWAETLAH